MDSSTPLLQQENEKFSFGEFLSLEIKEKGYVIHDSSNNSKVTIRDVERMEKLWPEISDFFSFSSMMATSVKLILSVYYNEKSFSETISYIKVKKAGTVSFQQTKRWVDTNEIVRITKIRLSDSEFRELDTMLDFDWKSFPHCNIAKRTHLLSQWKLFRVLDHASDDSGDSDS